MFTLDDETGTFRQTAADVTVPREAAEFAINMSNQRFWEKPVQRYISELLAGKDGPAARTSTCVGLPRWWLKCTAF